MSEKRSSVSGGARAGRFARAFSPANRAKSIAVTAFTVLALAALIFGLAAISDPATSPTPDSGVLSATEQSQQAYEEALLALESGDTTRAVTLLTKATTLDPANQAAKDRLDEVTRPTEPGGDDEEEPPVADDAFLKEVPDMSKLLPAAVDGYSLGTIDGGKPDATRSGTPTGRPGAITLAVWAVHDRGSAAQAKQYIEKTSKRAYGKNGAAVTIDGASGYFGTDGTRLATVTYTRGRYVFEVILTSNSGAPGNERALAEAAAKAFPDKP